MKPTLTDLINDGMDHIESESNALKNKLADYILSLDCSDDDKDIIIEGIMGKVNSNVSYRVKMDKFFNE